MGRLDAEHLMLMPIGRFARASRLSVKSLRNYDDSGLLPAAFVDPQSGYRYYRLEQLARADAIRSLRLVEMPLPLIAETLDGQDPEGSLMSHLSSLQQQRDEFERKAQQLRLRINQKEFTMSTTVTVKTHPAITAIGHRTDTSYAEIFHAIPAGFGSVMTFLTENNVDPAGAPFTLYYQAPDGDSMGDIAMCVPVANPIETDATTSMIEIPQGAAAVVTHQGSYDNMSESYASVAAWIEARGHRVIGPVREVYLNSPAEVAEADLLTEILFPIDAQDA